MISAGGSQKGQSRAPGRLNPSVRLSGRRSYVSCLTTVAYRFASNPWHLFHRCAWHSGVGSYWLMGVDQREGVGWSAAKDISPSRLLRFMIRAYLRRLRVRGVSVIVWGSQR